MAGDIGSRGGHLGRPPGTSRGRQGRRGGREQSSTPPRSPSPPLSPELEPIDISLASFEFAVTIHSGMVQDRMLLPRKFASLVDGAEPQQVVLLAVDVNTSAWPVEMLFDHLGQMFLANGCEEFARRYQIEVGIFIVFKYDGEAMLTVNVFDDTMCHRCYHSDSNSGSAE